MNVFKDLNNLPKFRNAVITVGTFDGVHKGHQQIISKLNALAKKQDGESILITFHPHPRFVLNPNDTSLKLINTLEEKISLLKNYGIDNLVIVPFTKEFSELSAEEYVTEFLLKNFHPKVIAIGYDHQFGKGRKGNIELLKLYQNEYSFEIERIEKEELDDITISSTKIRNALENGEVDLAFELMNHPYFIEGKVIKGKQLGRTIGFPTANIEIPVSYKLIPKTGVYAVKILVKNQEYKGMLNIGLKPTFDENGLSTEVHIFDFKEDIYSETVSVQFIAFLRNETKFDSLEDLKTQLEKDKIKALKQF